MVEFDTKMIGFGTVVKDYQEMSLRYLWKISPEGASSRDVWRQVNVDFAGTKTISRASIINFLNDYVDLGVLDYLEITGKGGHRRIYATKYNEEEFKQYIAKTVLEKLFDTWPDNTTIAVKSIIDKLKKE